MVITGSKGVREGSGHKVAILEGLGPGIGAVLIRVVERVRWPEIVGVGHRETPRVAVDGIDPNGKITATCGNPSIRVAHSQRPRSLGGKSQADRQAQVNTINPAAIHRLNTTRRATPSRVPLVSSAAAFLDTDKRRFHAISPTRFASRHSGPGPRLPIVLTLKCAVLPTAYPGLLVLLVAPPAAKALTSAA